MNSYLKRVHSPSLLRTGKKLLCSLEQYQIYGTLKDGVLTDLCFTGEDEKGERGLVDGCLELFEGGHRRRVEDTEWREVESFLRAENHRPALESEGNATEDLLMPWFTSIKKHLLRAMAIAQSPLVCTCFKVSYKTIEDELIAHTDLEALVAKYRVSSGCGSCLKMGKGKRFAYLEDIYHGVLAKKARGYYDGEEYRQLERDGYSSLGDESKSKPLDLSRHGPFANLSLLNKVRLVTRVLDEKVRPFLQRDGGDIELLDAAGPWDLLMSYQGSCNDCPSASAGTLEFIKETLTKEFGEPKIHVTISS